MEKSLRYHVPLHDNVDLRKGVKNMTKILPESELPELGEGNAYQTDAYEIPELTAYVTGQLQSGIDPETIWDHRGGIRIMLSEHTIGPHADIDRRVANALRILANWTPAMESSPLTGADYGPC